MKTLLALLTLTALTASAVLSPVILEDGQEVIVVHPQLVTQGQLSSQIGVSGGTNGNIVVISGNTLVDAGTAPYDPTTLIAMIGTNSTAIDNRYGANVTVVEASTNAQQNGTNLIAAVDAFCEASNDGTVVLTDGAYDIPEALAISNCVVKITATRSWPVYGRWEVFTAVATTPQASPLVTVTGNVTFDQSALVLGSLIDGVHIIGDVSSVRVGNDDRDNPILLQNCYIQGDVANGEDTSINMTGTFVSGSYAEASGYDSMIENCTIIGGNSFGYPVGGATDPKLISNSWVFGVRPFGSKSRGGVPYIRNCVVNGENAFYLNPSASGFDVFNVRFFDTSGSTNLWEGVDAATTTFTGVYEVHTNLDTMADPSFLNTYDYNDAVVDGP